MSAKKPTHLDEQGRAHMVDVGEKDTTARYASAVATLRMAPETVNVLREGRVKKGDVLAVARIAGIQAAKRTPELIPLCHHVALTSCEIEIAIGEADVRIVASAHARDRTGVEMEALTAASIAALTIYDMLKSIDREIVIEQI